MILDKMVLEEIVCLLMACGVGSGPGIRDGIIEPTAQEGTAWCGSER
jgi:hypothetical protein